MTAQNHTPGPWTTECLESKNDVDRSIVARTKGGNPIAVGRVYGEGVLSPPSPERVANARLIAAAPELLAALIRLRDCPDVQMESTDPETDAAREQANAAIYRATVPPLT